MNVPEKNDTEKWEAILARSQAVDGQFWYAVETTGIYCRPSCSSRLPRRENVRFYDRWEDAQQAGYRPCKRCNPAEPSQRERRAQMVAEACRLLETSAKEPSLEALAKTFALSPYHFHRLFKEATGLTPKQYALSRRAARLREALRTEGSVTEAIYAGGFGSSGHFYPKAAELLGMPPRKYQQGAPRVTIRFAVGECSLGSILVGATDVGVCSLLLGDSPEALVRDLQDRFPRAELTPGDGEFDAWFAAVVGFLDDPHRGLDLPLDARGTAFQQRVWQALGQIPVGTTATYSEIARRIGAPGAARAVAQACAANPVALAIPCHRVIRNDGSLSGYRWGLERKQALLGRERDVTRLP